MTHRISRIGTRAGDRGNTTLASGTQVEKDSPRMLAAGTVDELNSSIGVVLAHGATTEITECLQDVQHRLLEVSAQLSAPGQQRITDVDVFAVDCAIERFNNRLEPEKERVLPGGSLAAATCHVARSVCRRAEGQLVTLTSIDPNGNEFLIPFFNRLSDLLSVLACLLNKGSRGPATK